MIFSSKKLQNYVHEQHFCINERSNTVFVTENTEYVETHMVFHSEEHL